MTESEIAVAVLTYIQSVLPSGTPVYLMDVDAVRSKHPHVSAAVTVLGGVGMPEPAFDTTSRTLDAGSRQMVEVEVLVEAYGESSLDWMRRIAGAWLGRGGPAATLRATGVQPYGVDRVLEVSAFMDTNTEPRAQTIFRGYAPWTSPDDLDLSAGVTESVAISLDLGGRATATVLVDDVFLALSDGLSLDLDDGEPLLLEL